MAHYLAFLFFHETVNTVFFHYVEEINGIKILSNFDKFDLKLNIAKHPLFMQVQKSCVRFKK